MKKFGIILAFVLASVFAWPTEAAEKSAAPAAPGPGSFQIRNKAFGDLLRPENANGAVGTAIVLYPAQPWKCMTWKLQPTGASTFHLQNHFTSKTFAAETAGGKTNVVQVKVAKEEDQNPVWQFTRIEDGCYKIADARSGLVLTAVKEKNGSDVKVVVKAWDAKPEQKWELQPIDPKDLTM